MRLLNVANPPPEIANAIENLIAILEHEIEPPEQADVSTIVDEE
jgi:hypothetical protein